MPLPNWSDLEKRGLIKPSPGREQAVIATNANTAAKQQAIELARQQKSNHAQRK